jgi:Uri superfamily endonuclease
VLEIAKLTDTFKCRISVILSMVRCMNSSFDQRVSRKVEIGVRRARPLKKEKGRWKIKFFGKTAHIIILFLNQGDLALKRKEREKK